MGQVGAIDPLAPAAPALVGELAGPLPVVSPLISCADLDQIFRLRSDLTSVAVQETTGRVGLVMRDPFTHLMSGPYGYGRALWEKLPVAAATDWDPLLLAAGMGVAHACERLRRRARSARYHDALVRMPDGAIGRVSAARLFDALAEIMADQAVRDPLTGVANRAHFLDQLGRACADGSGQAVLVAYVDLDKMKQVNDALGHDAGDRLLRSAARRLAKAAGPASVVARLGGDEFAVLIRLPPAARTIDMALAVGEALRAALAETDPRLPAEAHSRASVGVAIGGEHPDGHTVLTEADMAMYRAKQSGGDAVRVVVDVEGRLRARHPAAGRGLARAIEKLELRLHYQPIIRVRDRAIDGVEALVRWQHPEQGRLSPEQFLPDVARAGLLPELDRWVLEAACADFGGWSAELGDRAPRHLNVNISAETLVADGLEAMVMDALQNAGLAPDRLRLELPESAELSVLTGAVPQLAAVRGHGVAIMLDDMGAGLSTLRHLSVLPVTGIKIDQLFVSGMLDNRNDHAVVRLLSDLGHNLGLAVTAEGVESAEHLAELRRLGVPHAQGYYTGRPQPPDRLLDTLQATLLPEPAPWLAAAG
ncbi:EAL domain-containing protein [Phytohabitans sp. ZYX-F-186]|uniref:EAL domain-containing protein n=1 Tax=Phytohabitans maris TaxID=3071409 RepID=A0ABU0ZBR8_9ACTN|nr:EAL domain-containing protein [Phytohabitans sp. ZYX-F-186]MDQ7904495.1 EAL domain-containing protein [Phytohabitans sp. ZYX-F-186]